MLQPNGKELAADGVFFNQGGPFNQGNIYTFDTDEFTAAMETAETKVGTVNEQGIKLQKEFTYEKTLNKTLINRVGTLFARITAYEHINKTLKST